MVVECGVNAREADASNPKKTFCPHTMLSSRRPESTGSLVIHDNHDNEWHQWWNGQYSSVCTEWKNIASWSAYINMTCSIVRNPFSKTSYKRHTSRTAAAFRHFGRSQHAGRIMVLICSLDNEASPSLRVGFGNSILLVCSHSNISRLQ